MGYTLDTVNGVYYGQYDQKSFGETLEFLYHWAYGMGQKSPKYNFSIIKDIRSFYRVNDWITKKQMESLRNIWFKWKVYKTHLLCEKLTVKEFGDGYASAHFGFPTDTIAVDRLFRYFPDTTHMCMSYHGETDRIDSESD